MKTFFEIGYNDAAHGLSDRGLNYFYSAGYREGDESIIEFGLIGDDDYYHFSSEYPPIAAELAAEFIAINDVHDFFDNFSIEQIS